MCSNLAVEVICAACIDENGDWLLFNKSSNFHCLRVGVTNQRMHCIVSQLGLFLRGFIFRGSDGSRGGRRLRHGWLGSDLYPSYFVVQSFFLDSREENYRHKSVRLPRLYFSSNLRL
ncbi:hypothetical protein BHM03_00003803 [Ensete ventricosum]|nr:hypothetical protein BHM03_00003803 [Ensete ventricosum]